MQTDQKISPAFAAYFADSGPNEKREAIVILRTAAEPAPQPRGRVSEIRKRLTAVRARAAVQEKAEGRVFGAVQKLSKKSLPSSQSLATNSIGGRVLPVASVEVTRKTLPEIASQPDVLAVLPNQRIRLIRPKEVDYSTLARSEERDKMTWGLKELGVPDVWSTTRGEHVIVAILDTGVHGEHPVLDKRVKDFVVIDPLGRRIQCKPSFDCDGHGTHVCGTIAGGKTASGVSIGVAPEADVLAAGVLVGNSTLHTLVEGLAWAVENGANIISMSLGFSYYEPYFTLVFQDLIERYDVLPVVAIGNENHGNTSSPGNAWNALSVGAIEKMPGNKIEVVPFSSGASLVFPGQEPNALVTKPDIVAPGVQVFSCIPPENRRDGRFEYTYMDGTSMATPHVAGVAALLMSAKPNAPVTDIMNVLKSTAKHPVSSTNRPDNRWGMGVVQPIEALKALS